jgi:mRNA interferase RelE/StbE
MFEVILSPEAGAFFEDSDKALARKLSRCDPRLHNNIKRLAGKYSGLSRYRVGDWRVIYRIDDKANCVLVLSIANRREAY